jgi:hypothetical protein
MADLRRWLDHNRCVPVDFSFSAEPPDTIVVSVDFADDQMAELFERDFGADRRAT